MPLLLSINAEEPCWIELDDQTDTLLAPYSRLLFCLRLFGCGYPTWHKAKFFIWITSILSLGLAPLTYATAIDEANQQGFKRLHSAQQLPERLRFKHVVPLATELVGEVLSLHQDQYGFIWIGGKDGLARYDGHDFKVHRHRAEDATSLSSSVISDIVEDPNGDLWLATNKGVNHFDRKAQVFHHYTHNSAITDSLHLERTISLFIEDGKTLWIGGDGGLNALDLPTKTMRRLPDEQNTPEEAGLEGLYVMDIDQGADGTLYLATGFGLKVWDRKTRRVTTYGNPLPKGLPNSIIRTVLVDSQNRLWVGTEEGLSRMNLVTEQFHFYFNPADENTSRGSAVWDLLEDHTGEIWGATDGGGLIRYRPEEDRFTAYTNDNRNPDSITSIVIRTLLEDSTGDIWLGAYPGGVDVLSRYNATFDSYRNTSDDPLSISANGVTSLLENADGNLWIGTDGGGVNFYNAQENEYQFIQYEPDAESSIGSESIMDMVLDSNNNLWLGHWDGGVSRINLDTQKIVNYRDKVNSPNHLQRPHVFSLFIDSQGDLWAGSLGGGLAKYNPESDVFQNFLYDPKIGLFNAERVWNINEDSRGNLWLGTHAGLVKVDRKTNTSVRYQHDKHDDRSLSSDWVISVMEDSRGRLWVGTQEAGLNLYDYETESFTRIQKEDGLASNLIAALLEDDNGVIWFSTNKGLSSYHPNTHTIKNYSANNGLQANQFNYDAAVKTHDGDLIFGGVNGYTRFSPDELTPNTAPPPVVITALTVHEKEAEIGEDSVIQESILTADTIVLTHKQNVFTIQYSALNFRIGEDNQYAYMLEGFDDDWQMAGTKRSKSYTNIDAGEYVFRVKASNNEGVWNDMGTSIKIRVIPAPWLTWWAYLIYFLSVVAVIVWYIYEQRKVIDFQEGMMKKLKNADRLKDEFVASTSHELRTPLFGIVGLAETLMDELKGRLKPTEKHNINMIIASGKRLVIQVNDILDYAKIRDNALEVNVRPIQLFELAEMVIPLTAPIIGNKNLELINKVPQNLPAVLADAHRLQQILINLISNAIHHTQEGRITVTAKQVDDKMEISVTDTGKGIPKDKFDELFEKFTQLENVNTREQMGTGLGLSITKRLVELQNGKIWIESEVNVGSTFTFTLPITDQHGEKINLSENSDTRIQVLTTRNRSGVDSLDTQESDEPLNRIDLRTVKSKGADSDQPNHSEANQGMEANVLIVDDETVNRMVLSAYLKDKPFKIYEAESGEAALKIIDKNPNIDLVLLDLMMPGMSGFETCEKIREKYTSHELPVLFTTAKGHIEDMEHAFMVGGNDFIHKPVDRKELGARVMLHVKQLKDYRNVTMERYSVGA